MHFILKSETLRIWVLYIIVLERCIRGLRVMKILEVPISRYRHCHSVGKRMQDYASTVLGWPKERCDEMFVLGCIHDIGYELDGDAFDHDNVLADILGESYKFNKEVRYHSKWQTECVSEEMLLLYFGDATVDGQGNWCTFDERLTDLKRRYGEESEVYKVSEEIVEQLRNRGFNDRCQLE